MTEVTSTAATCDICFVQADASSNAGKEIGELKEVCSAQAHLCALPDSQTR
jgi:hypothetical protein